jgi:hypothetical protein
MMQLQAPLEIKRKFDGFESWNPCWEVGFNPLLGTSNHADKGRGYMYTLDQWFSNI